MNTAGPSVSAVVLAVPRWSTESVVRGVVLIPRRVFVSSQTKLELLPATPADAPYKTCVAPTDAPPRTMSAVSLSPVEGMAILAEPSNETPAMVRAVWSVVAVEALPVSAPVNVVAATEVSPDTADGSDSVTAPVAALAVPGRPL